MPRGTRHTLTGTLDWNERNRIHVLNMEGGGYWFVDMPGHVKNLLGREVTIEGARSGFNMLDVHRLLAIDGKPPGALPTTSMPIIARISRVIRNGPLAPVTFLLSRIRGKRAQGRRFGRG